MLGNVLSLRYVDGKTNTENKYLWDSAQIKNNEKETREIELLASWYEMDLNDTAPTLKFGKNTFIRMKFYVASLSRNALETKNENDTINLSRKYSKSVLKFLKCIQ